ncbi:MAG: 1-(5-phosphoribosyl)-5-[(5-phosphoribosylamino)methylideneamino]imidazole-4-carboxamide isomerase [Nitrospinae bacterium]|nr:1-(5-phosphoribosyl)-5-[(5-phosphoribosylamino)methylideneamino]imidazole-4-carboxamide isomerase [Nitrospinota bacterium]
MRILPAIDLMDGKVVRLRKGDYAAKTVYADDPAEVARRFAAAGAEIIHLVDLDGAKAGYPVNTDAIRAISDAAQIPVEVGGGIRDVETIGAYLDLGATQVVLGTAAIERPDFVLAAADLYPDRIWVGLDCKDGKPATKGWLATVDLDPVELAERYAAMGAAGIVYTDIATDGMMAGPNLAGLADFARRVSLPVTASGGVSSVADIQAIVALGVPNITGAIIGRALYDGAVDLAEAIARAKG